MKGSCYFSTMKSNQKSYDYAKGFVAQAGLPAEALCVGGLMKKWLNPSSFR